MVEMQFGDFITCGFNQIVNNLAKTHYRWGAGVPVVIRVPVGGGTGAGPYHSQNPEAWFTHVAGLKVVTPATPSDAKGLLLAAFEDGNPGALSGAQVPLSIGEGSGGRRLFHRADRSGAASRARDATSPSSPGASASRGHWTRRRRWRATACRSRSSTCARSLPWDRDCVLESVRKTSRAIVLHEAPMTGGFGGEIAAAIGEDAFAWLDAPVTRVSGLDMPVPFSKALEEIYSPKGRLIDAIRKVLVY